MKTLTEARSSEHAATVVAQRSDSTRLNRSWLRLNSFYVMGGFAVEHLPESHREAFREAQREFIALLSTPGAPR